MATEVLAVLDRPARPRTPRRPRVTEGRLVMLACAVVYLGVALWFWRSGLVPGDAMSRVANAYYTLYSRDPHLAALGFVWNPLPSLMLLPALPLSLMFPALTQDALIAGIASALSMAGAVTVIHDMLRRLGVRRLPRLVLTLAVALHPMILIYAGNGMSESLFLLCLAGAARGLQQWLAEGRAESLVVVGLALGLSYGTRYEALAPAAAVPVVVFLVSWWRARGSGLRRHTAIADAMLVGLPALAAVALWAVASKLIVNQWFATFSSEYGNSAQVSANAGGIASMTGDTAPDRLAYGLTQLLGLHPALPLAAFVAGAVALYRRDPRLLAPVSVFGSVLAFDNLAFLAGSSFGWLRFQIATIPLVVLLVGGAIARRPSRLPAGLTPATARGVAPVPASSPRPGRAAGPLGSLGIVAALTAALVGAPASLWVLNTPALAREESEWFTPDGAARTSGLTRLNHRVAADLDAMGLPDGAVVTDSAYAFAIIIASDHPEQFVINSDRDFREALEDPAGHGARYLLVSTAGAADAVRLRHPGPSRSEPGVREWADRVGNVQWLLVPV